MLLYKFEFNKKFVYLTLPVETGLLAKAGVLLGDFSLLGVNTQVGLLHVCVYSLPFYFQKR